MPERVEPDAGIERLLRFDQSADRQIHPRATARADRFENKVARKDDLTRITVERLAE
jgi:hypothetical protein